MLTRSLHSHPGAGETRRGGAGAAAMPEPAGKGVLSEHVESHCGVCIALSCFTELLLPHRG